MNQFATIEDYIEVIAGERDPAALAADLRDGIITEAGAKEYRS
jgi:hypothetical protein